MAGCCPSHILQVTFMPEPCAYAMVENLWCERAMFLPSTPTMLVVSPPARQVLLCYVASTCLLTIYIPASIHQINLANSNLILYFLCSQTDNRTCGQLHLED